MSRKRGVNGTAGGAKLVTYGNMGLCLYKYSNWQEILCLYTM